MAKSNSPSRVNYERQATLMDNLTDRNVSIDGAWFNPTE